MVEKNILITGAGKGIGNKLLIDCLREGFFVYAIVRSKKDFLNLKKKINQKKCKLYLGNIKNISLIKKILRDSIVKKKKINCLVNNAGERQRKDFTKIKKSDIHHIFENNFFSHFFVIQKMVEYFKKNKLKDTSIVNVGSIVGKRGFSHLSGYASTKTALEGLTRSLAIELANEKIRINIVNPGFIKTSYFNKFKKNKELYNWTLKKTPLRKWGESSDVSELILFLLSDKSKYINGQSISIDGGWTAQ